MAWHAEPERPFPVRPRRRSQGIAPAARHLHIPKSTLSKRLAELEKSLASGVLQRVLPAWTAGKVTTTLLMPHRRGQLPSVRAVADFLAARLAADSQA